MKKNQKAFTLLELLIVFIIIGILSAITIPSYQKHIVKAKILDALNFTNSIKLATTDFYLNNGFWPSNKDINLKSISSSYIKNIKLEPLNNKNNYIEKIIITFKGDSKIENKSLSLISENDEYNISWNCKPTDINSLDIELLPSSCL